MYNKNYDVLLIGFLKFDKHEKMWNFMWKSGYKYVKYVKVYVKDKKFYVIDVKTLKFEFIPRII